MKDSKINLYGRCGKYISKCIREGYNDMGSYEYKFESVIDDTIQAGYNYLEFYDIILDDDIKRVNFGNSIYNITEYGDLLEFKDSVKVISNSTSKEINVRFLNPVFCDGFIGYEGRQLMILNTEYLIDREEFDKQFKSIVTREYLNKIKYYGCQN